MAQELGDILSGKEPEKVERVEVPVEEKPVEEKTQPRDAEGKFTKAEEKPAEAPKAEEKPKEAPKEEFTAKEKALLAAATDERRKRQELERQLNEYRQKQTQAAPEDKKTFWDDPDGKLTELTTYVQKEMTQNRLSTSEAIARSRYPDFQEKIETFVELVKESPVLYQQMLAAPDPADFAYKHSKNHMTLKEVGSLDEVIAKKLKEERIKWEAEKKAEDEKAKAERRNIPGTLSDATGGANKPIYTGPTPLGEIIKLH